jgi:hypothetical protein
MAVKILGSSTTLFFKFTTLVEIVAKFEKWTSTFHILCSTLASLR